MPCSICNITLNAGLKCTVCFNFTLCIQCFEKDGHYHEMKATSFSPSCTMLPRDQLQTSPSQVAEVPLKRYVRILFHAYRNQEGNYEASLDSLFNHVVYTKLQCGCIFCKQMLFIYEYHHEKCRTPKCRVASCPVINERFLKKCIVAMSTQAIKRNLLTGQLPQTNEQASESAVSNWKDPLEGNTSLARKFTIQRCVRTLVHACYCVEPNCMPLSCYRMKRILGHVKVCKRRLRGGCPICKQLTTLCCYHAKNCTDSKCSVMLCSAIKRKAQLALKKQLAA